MKKSESRLRLWLIYALVRGPFALLRLFPFGLTRALSVRVARLVFHIDRRHREVALTNLRLAFPEKDDAWRRRVARANFENFGHMVAEVSHLHLWTPENIRSHVSFENYEVYERAKEKRRGCFYATAHFGNWELLAHAHALVGRPFNAVVRPVDNPLLDDYFERMRTSTGNRIIDKKRGGIKAMIAALRRNEDIGILIDQYSRRSKGVYAPLFGVLASTTAGVALMALRTRTPIVPVFMIREPGRMRFRVLIFPEIALPDTGDKKEDIRVTTERMNEALERVVRMHPDHWLWGHRRWKKSPDIAGNLYRGGRIVRRHGDLVSGGAGRGNATHTVSRLSTGKGPSI